MRNVKELLLLIALDQHHRCSSKLCESPVVVSRGVWTRRWVSERWRGREDVISKARPGRGRARLGSRAASVIESSPNVIEHHRSSLSWVCLCVGCVAVCVSAQAKAQARVGGSAVLDLAMTASCETAFDDDGDGEVKSFSKEF